MGFLSKIKKLLKRQNRINASAQRNLAGASTHPRFSFWHGDRTGPISETRGIDRLRYRARDLFHNNPYARKAIITLTNNIIGTGIKPIWRTGDERLDQRIQNIWDTWVEECSANSPITFYGLQELAIRAWLVDGEVLIRRRLRRTTDGLTVPLQLQVLEVDHLDTTRDTVITPDQNYIVGGIEFDTLGRRKAYWLYTVHPGELGFALESKPVPASSIIHLYQELRPGQVRGISWLAPAIIALWDFAGYQDAERMRKRAEACFVAAVVGQNPDETPSDEIADGIGQTRMTDALGNPIEELSPGLVAYLPPYKDIKFHSPSAVSGAAEYSKVMLHEIASGLCIPYEILTGDLSEVNFTSMRMGMVEFRLLVRSLRRHYVIPMLCQPVLNWFIDASIAAGILPDTEALYKCKWSEPQIEEVDRLREAEADLAEMRAGTSSWSEIVAAKGKDPAALLEEIQKEREQFAKFGIILDSNPNVATKSGGVPRSEVIEYGRAKSYWQD